MTVVDLCVESDERIAVRVSRNCIAGNIILTLFKLFAGIYAHSSAMISDAVHSFSDIFGGLVVIVGVRCANRESDKEHPYGHERMECVAAIVLAAVLLAVGAGIGYSGARKIFFGLREDAAVPGVLALLAAVVSIVVKEWMYWYTRAAAKRVDSGALMAEAWHHRSDALSSIGSFAGIFGARSGFPLLDPVAAVVICFFIVKAAFSIFVDSMNRMTDRACEDGIVEEIRALVLTQQDVMRVDRLQTRLFGNKIYVDVEISADGDVPLRRAHDAAQRVHDVIEERFPRVKHCMVHVNPFDPRIDAEHVNRGSTLK